MADAERAASEESPPSDRESGPGTEGRGGGQGRRGGRGRRDVVVPLRLYKTITVFSTLIALVSVVLGFTLLDAATLRVSILRGLLTGLLRAVGFPVAPDLLSAVLAIAGLTSIGLGAGAYTLGTRFRARGMGKSQEDSGESADDG